MLISDPGCNTYRSWRCCAGSGRSSTLPRLAFSNHHANGHGHVDPHRYSHGDANSDRHVHTNRD